jgi:hypothetical protein
MTSTMRADIRSGTVISANLGYVTNNTKFCIRLGDGSPRFEGKSTYTCRIQKVREVSVTRLPTLFAFHGTCVRFQWHTKRVYLHSTGRAWGFSDTSKDFISIPRDLCEVSVTYQNSLFAFHGTCVRFQWHTKRPYLLSWLPTCRQNICNGSAKNKASRMYHVSQLYFHLHLTEWRQ